MKPRVVTLVTWAFAPDWLTVEEAAELSGHDPEVIRELIEDGTLETREEGGVYLIEKASLREFQEALLLVRQLMMD
ncbi:MAG: helix-turn-helix domain-containing protein [Anaerolineae bacterium]|nr:helix-turn-helix domain-containing protein [Anaerolineae bacterium]